ncbi:sulfotransferase family protein [Rhizobiaceae bacterium n13]|uniref:Sulfotransferase family protein n=1 Tax=Ferirhizobium litorale TaxID=2927786 RepID=A0AAE3QG18_9HYPH|nr:sulfotransferase family 2 domain-containing protein [Fererhizobium litorale]MDI7862207.1 sulfotransferase family protein [Fererhizobium litorale]MDI7922519.1 sulfotransferase family protein [Fererhizobium litorale]
MLISHQHKFIYLKTHKTASTTVEGVLEVLCTPQGHTPQHKQAEMKSDTGYVAGRGGGQKPADFLQAHSPANEVRRKVGTAVFESYRKVYTVRNPYDKVISWFWHVMPKDTNERLAQDFSASRQLFNDWLQMRPVLPADLQYYRTKQGFFEAHLIRYENIAGGLKQFADELQTDIDLSAMPTWKTQVRAHKDRSYDDYYEPKARDIVRRIFAHDFETFNYAE